VISEPCRTVMMWWLAIVCSDCTSAPDVLAGIHIQTPSIQTTVIVKERVVAGTSHNHSDIWSLSTLSSIGIDLAEEMQTDPTQSTRHVQEAELSSSLACSAAAIAVF
jgi:hypothetical protein